MPITQDRMLKLVSCAQNYARAWKDVCKAIDGAISEMEHGKDAKEELYGLRSAQIATQPSEQDAQTVAVEAYHFKHFARRNDKAKIRMSQKRVNEDFGGYEAPRQRTFKERKESLQPQIKTNLAKDGITVASQEHKGKNELGAVTIVPDPATAEPDTPLGLDDDFGLSQEVRDRIEKETKK